jgi:hypothetical protein
MTIIDPVRTTPQNVNENQNCPLNFVYHETLTGGIAWCIGCPATGG